MMNRTAWIILVVSALAIVVTILLMRKKTVAPETNGNGNGNNNGIADDTLAEDLGQPDPDPFTENEVDLGMA